MPTLTGRSATSSRSSAWANWGTREKQRLLERLTEQAQAALTSTPGSFAAFITSGKERQAAHLDLIDEAFSKVEAYAVAAQKSLAEIPDDWTEDQVNEYLGELDLPGVDRVLITMPPRHGKTRRASRWAPLWWLRRHPDHRVVVASYSGDLADEHGRWVRDTIASDKRVGLSLHPGSFAANRFDLLPVERKQINDDGQVEVVERLEGGGMVTTGVGGILTGRGAHLLIVDDPIKDDASAQSPLQRQRLWDWWTSTALTRLEPGGVVIVIQTRWHEDDLAGRLLEQEGDEWLHIDLPAICDDDDDALSRKIGEALWPARYPLERLLKIKKRVGERVWASLYQQKPRPQQGGVFKWEWITDNRVYPSLVPNLERIVVGLDPSGGDTAKGSGRVNDLTGIVAAGRANNEAYVLADASMRGTSGEWGLAAVDLAIALKADAFVVESNFGGDMAGTILRNAWAQRQREGKTKGLMCPAIREVTATQGKRLRAEPVAQRYEQGHVHHVGEFPFLETELTSWMPSLDSPDRMDADVHALTDLLEGPGEPTRTRRSDDRLRGRR